MLSRSLLALTLIALAVPAWADNFAYRDASGRNIIFPCTDGGGVCTPSVAGTPTVDQEVDLVEVGGVPVALGQAAMAASIPVAIASNQAEIPVGGSGTAGTADASVVTVQGIASMTPVQVGDNSSSLTVDQPTGTNLHTVIDSGTITTVTTVTGATITAGTTSGTPVVTVPAISTVSTTITRPADTNAYAANDAFANSTSAPTAGGFTLTSACRASGGYGTILDAVVTASAATAYQGEIWIFDQAVTAVNDNAALTISDAEAQTVVGVIPFTTNDITAANSLSYITGLNIGYTCVGTANLRFLVKIMAAVTPGSAEVLSVRVKVQN